jgi:hypothetical protein
MVARTDGAHAFADGLHHSGGFVPQDDRERKRQISLDVMEVAVADAGRGDPDLDLAGPRPLQLHGLDGERLSHLVQNGGAHAYSLLSSSSRDELFRLRPRIPPIIT